MKKLIDLAARWSGAGKVWDALDGWKTKIAAVAAILSGAAGLLGDVAKLIDLHSVSAMLDFVKALPTDANWLMLVGGVGLLGIGHKLDKAAPEEPKK